MSTKNPYEIRAELIALATEHFNAIQAANYEFALKAFEVALKNGSAIPSDWQKHVPTPPSIDQVMEYANRIYSFVSGVK